MAFCKYWWQMAICRTLLGLLEVRAAAFTSIASRTVGRERGRGRGVVATEQPVGQCGANGGKREYNVRSPTDRIGTLLPRLCLPRQLVVRPQRDRHPYGRLLP